MIFAATNCRKWLIARLRQGFSLALGSCRLLGLAQTANDPHHQAMLRSSMNPGQEVTLEVSRSGFNFLHPRHREYVFAGRDEIRGNFFIDTYWKF